jgi:uncharacterized RDD family membrane protein YckC/two-component sensor histidine kinase
MKTQTQTQKFTYGKVRARFLALVIDSIILLSLNFILVSALNRFEPAMPVFKLYEIKYTEDGSTKEVTKTKGWPSDNLGLIVTIILSCLYCSLLESSSKQGTLGKMALGLKVADSKGNRITFSRAIGRYFAKYISKLTLGIGYLTSAFHPRKQALHDLIAGTIVLKYDAEQEIRDKEEQLKIAKLNELKTKAELNLLQSKINPHFLYNSLNVIASYTHDQPEKAERMAVELSKFLRSRVESSNENLITMSSELETLKSYIEIEKIRFEENLDIKILLNVDGNTLIPKFLLQPLVENAIKHGMKHAGKHGEILIRIDRKSDNIVISVEDNGAPFPTDIRLGYGLTNTYEKLDLLYGEDYSIEFKNADVKSIIITYKIS